MKTGIVYKITNLKNGKIYIGQTIRKLNLRFQSHWKESKHSDTYFHRSLRKYGRENFKIEPLLIDVPKDMLNEAEISAIYLWQTKIPIGYNMTDGGNGCNAQYEISEDARTVISNFHKGKPKTDQHRKNISEALKCKPKSESHKHNLSVAVSGFKHSESAKEKMSINAPKTKSQKHKLSMAASKRGKKLNPITRKYYDPSIKGDNP
jgi:group I intron endonuclease